jgi:hypothetical protein
MNENDEQANQGEWLNIPEYKSNKIFSYNGFYFPDYCFNTLTGIKNLQPRKNDVWVVSFPKSGNSF